MSAEWKKNALFRLRLKTVFNPETISLHRDPIFLKGLRVSEWVIFTVSDLLQHTGQDLETKVFFVS